MLGGIAVAIRRLSTVGIVVVAFVVATTSLTFARATHTYGEMVDYPLTFPVDGAVRLSDTFTAPRSNGDHHAQDLMAPKMTPVVAAASGTVTWVNWSRDPANPNPDRCCTMVISHDDGWESWYIHLNNDTPGTDDGQGWGIADGISVGVRVEAGQLIGWVGDSGNAENTPPHLHFELRDPDGVIVNPYQALINVCGSRCATSAPASVPRAPAGPNDVLVRGSFGDVVKDLQAALAAAGFDPGPVDGIFGGKTLSAVTAFQESRGLLVDGKVGPQTKGALASGAAPAPTNDETAVDSGPASTPGVAIPYGTYGSMVMDLQRLLADLGHAPGPVDGAFGPLTKGAVQRFQSSRGLDSTGVVDSITWDALVGGGPGDSVEVVVPYGSRGSQVSELQSRLAAKGHAPGPIDGIFGPMTKAAVRAFQGAAGLTDSGVVDRTTWDSLTG